MARPTWGRQFPAWLAAGAIAYAAVLHAQLTPAYPAWAEGATYRAGDKVSYQGYDYRALVLQTDYAGAGWTPSSSPTLWVALDPDVGSPVVTPGPTPSPMPAGCSPAWSNGTIYLAGAAVSFSGVNYRANWWTVGNSPATSSGPAGSGQPWTAIAGCGGATPSPIPAPAPTLAPVTTPTPTPTPTPAPGGPAGTIGFHLLLGAGTAQDSLSLAGDNYTDLVLSNLVAGVMMGHLILEQSPGLNFNKDYLYGSPLGQLLQENIETELYRSAGTLIDPSPLQAAVFGVGQGGPYQINNYAADLVSGTYDPAGHSLINYIALQGNLGFSFSTAATQYRRPTPPSFNDKYFSPMLTAYFHYNDFVALSVLGKGPGGWTTPWQPAWDSCLSNFQTLSGTFLDILLNVAYNQGYYGPLVARYSALGASATSTTVAMVNSYASVWGSQDSYQQYPYQVRYYLDQFYGNPIPTTSVTALEATSNHVVFTTDTLASVFSSSLGSLSYTDFTGHLAPIPTASAHAAFSLALEQINVPVHSTLDVGVATSRAQLFQILEQAITNLEISLPTRFNATSNGPRS